MPRSPAAEGAADAVVRLDEVSKRFGSTIAVDRLTLEVARGELLALLGPSGCGKTTTLRLIAGFETPDEGTLEIEGAPMHATPRRPGNVVPPERRPVNTVFQSYALFPHLSVGDNVAYGLRRSKIALSEIEPRVRSSLAQVHLDGFADRMPSTLSGGQQQRVALARALVNEPAVLLLDEPFGALDQQLRMKMRDELRRLQRETRIAFVLVTHDQHEALSVADRIAVLDRGHLEQIGPPNEVYDRPRTLFAARFLGACNLLAGDTVAPGIAALGDGTKVRIEPEAFGSGTFGIRPEKVSFGDGDQGCTLSGWLREVTFEGSLLRAAVDLANGTSFAVVERNDGDAAAIASRIGDSVKMRWRPEHAFWIADRLEPVSVLEDAQGHRSTEEV